jgi:maltose O-acetyltransferase
MATDLIRIANEVMLSPYCVIVSGNHTSINGSYRYGPAILAPIVIEKGLWIASHVVVTAGCTIGENSLIAANAVVTQNIPANVIAGGIPARIINQNPPS